MNHEKKPIKTIVFSPAKSMGIHKAIIYRVNNYGFSLETHILCNGEFELCSSYNSTHIQDIQKEIKQLERM